jgi:hypothetical protein
MWISNMKMTSNIIRPGSEFRFTAKPRSHSAHTFTAFLPPDDVWFTRRVAELFNLPDDMLVNWHGAHHTEGFATSVGELKTKGVTG